MDKKPLVTVVIPVYNVEQYLCRCIDSVTNQTYTNLEIILIDDGSKDGSGAICDKYAKNESRIKVIHKENAGVSAARNDGINMSKGNYIIFIDSDDCIAPDYIEYLYSLIKNNDCEISVCSYLTFRDEIKDEDIKENIQIYTNEQAFEELNYQKSITTGPVAKMFRRDLLKGVEFPVGVSYGEDLGTIYKLIYKAKNVVVSNKKKYYYFQRENSLVNSSFSSKKMKAIDYANEIILFAKNNMESRIISAKNRLFMEAIFIYITIPSKGYKDEKKQLKNIIKENRNIVLKDNNSKKGYRIIALASFLGMWTIKLLFKIKNKVNS